MFIANLPFYGLQTVMSLYIARRLHLHPIPVVAGSQLSTPPVGIALSAAAISLGYFLLHGKWVGWQDFDITRIGFGQMIGPLIGSWLLGGFLIGLTLGTAAFFAARYAIGLLDQRDAQAAGDALHASAEAFT